jgi:hypothetical protein
MSEKPDFTKTFAKGGHTGWKHKMAQGGGVSKNAEYVSKRNIDKVTYNKGKDVKTVTGKDLLDGVYVSKKVTTKSGKMYVELKSVVNADFGDSSERGKNIALKKVNVTSIDEAKKVVRAFIDENDLGGGNWVGGKVFENVKTLGTLLTMEITLRENVKWIKAVQLVKTSTQFQ